MLPIVQAAAIVARAQEAIKRETSWCFGFLLVASVLAEVEESLDRLGKHVPYLERLSRLWEEWEESTADAMVVNRARKLLRHIEDLMGRLRPHQAVSEEINSLLTGLAWQRITSIMQTMLTRKMY